jgi:hypothetical protein
MFQEPILMSLESPRSTYFWQLHGLIDHWRAQFEDQGFSIQDWAAAQRPDNLQEMERFFRPWPEPRPGWPWPPRPPWPPTPPWPPRPPWQTMANAPAPVDLSEDEFRMVNLMRELQARPRM